MKSDKIKQNSFSVVVPTYTGEEHLDKCLNSILKQVLPEDIVYEVVVVIDGPNEKLRNIAEASKKLFQEASIAFRIKQFEENKGRFEARVYGAKLSTFSHILFIDDRIEFESNYFINILDFDEKVVMPNVIEREPPNQVSKLINVIRTKMYDRNIVDNYKAYYITKDNFEKSPKGTTSLWIHKKTFLAACRSVRASSVDLKTLSDDTKILKKVVDDGVGILRKSKAFIYYNHRSSALDELKHFYQRGPKFVDYYLSPGTRFYYHIIFFSIIVFAFIPGAYIVKPEFTYLVIVLLAIVNILVSTYLSKNVKDFLSIFVILPVVLLCFGLGVINGLMKKGRSKLRGI